MKISNINTVIISPQNNKHIIRFNGKPKTVKGDDGKEYVKVPKSEYNRDKWCGRIILVILAIDVLHFLFFRKPETWEEAYKDLIKIGKNIK